MGDEPGDTDELAAEDDEQMQGMLTTEPGNDTERCDVSRGVPRAPMCCFLARALCTKSGNDRKEAAWIGRA